MLKTAVYIKGIGCIAPDTTLLDPYGHAIEKPDREYLRSADPDYKKYISPMAARRMSRVVKMGIYAAKTCLEDARVDMPDAIVTGTGLGCIEDTEKFLISMIQNEEKLLNPTPFIQSTHNTVSSQISLFLKCHAYNTTYSHRGLSFEPALLDSLMLLHEKAAGKVLLGGIDEITPNSFLLQKRLGLFRNLQEKTPDVLNSASAGSLAGEGATFFVLDTKASPDHYARIGPLKSIHGSLSEKDVCKAAETFLQQHQIAAATIDLLMLGFSGDQKTDSLYHGLHKACFANTPVACFKHLCGEHQTATAYAMALAANMLKNGQLPQKALCHPETEGKPKQILIYNHFQNINHSFILLQHHAF